MRHEKQTEAIVGTIKPTRKQKLLHYAKLALIAGLVLWATLTYILCPIMVSGTSMVPTLQSGDILLNWKVPQTWARITGGQYIPKRSNIVIVYDQNAHKEFVKRVIALPHEQINIADGAVRVSSVANPQGFDPDTATYGKNLVPTAGAFIGSTGDGQIFVMGDNRALGQSIDSRSSVGNIPSKNIIGHVVLRLFPFNEITIF